MITSNISFQFCEVVPSFGSNFLVSKRFCEKEIKKFKCSFDRVVLVYDYEGHLRSGVRTRMYFYFNGYQSVGVSQFVLEGNTNSIEIAGVYHM